MKNTNTGGLVIRSPIKYTKPQETRPFPRLFANC